nr:hypothetical protein GW17_00033112 [Ipomoea batatas]
MLAHPPNPNPTTKTQHTMKMFSAYTAVQLGKKNGGFSAAFCNGGFPVSEHMSERRDDVDGEANKEGTNSRVDWAKEGEDDGQEPYRYDHGQPSQGPHANASRVVHPYHLLPHEVQRRARKWVRYLVDEHEDDRGVSPGGFGEEGEGVGVVEKLVAERPVHGGCRW